MTIGGGPVAVEVKVQGSPKANLSQLGRYAAHSEVDAVIPASGRRTLLATAIHETPVPVGYLGGGLWPAVSSGRSKHVRGHWDREAATAYAITADPDVGIRIKRNFPSIRTSRSETRYASDTDQHCRELE